MARAPAVVRVFVCSPFRDMQAERAHLHEVVFPNLRPRFQAQGVHLEVIDPRLGEASEEGAEGIATLAQSLEAIDACRPFFLGILGVRTGKVLEWVPEVLGEEFPRLRYFARSSRTFLETYHAVLGDPEHASHSYFYFRNPAFLMHVPRRYWGTYFPENRMALHKLEAFKEAIRTSGRPVTDYTCRWDDASHRVAGLGGFGQAVAADLLRAIGAPLIEEVPVPVESPAAPAVKRTRAPKPSASPEPIQPPPSSPQSSEETYTFEKQPTEIAPGPMAPERESEPAKAQPRTAVRAGPNKKPAPRAAGSGPRAAQKSEETDLQTGPVSAGEPSVPINPDDIDLAALFGDDEETTAEPAAAPPPEPAQRKPR